MNTLRSWLYRKYSSRAINRRRGIDIPCRKCASRQNQYAKEGASKIKCVRSNPSSNNFSLEFVSFFFLIGNAVVCPRLRCATYDHNFGTPIRRQSQEQSNASRNYVPSGYLAMRPLSRNEDRRIEIVGERDCVIIITWRYTSPIRMEIAFLALEVELPGLFWIFMTWRQIRDCYWPARGPYQGCPHRGLRPWKAANCVSQLKHSCLKSVRGTR